METDEDIFLVIIAEDDQCNSAENFSVRNEDRFDLGNRKLAVQQIIASAQKYGKVINVDPKDKKIKVYEESIIEVRNKQRTIKKTKKKTKRTKMLSPSERKSFIAELKRKYPELNNDKDALLDKIVEAMTNIKKPRLPSNCCRPKDNKFECKKCKRLYFSHSAATEHFQGRHGPRYLKCFACGADFRETTTLYKHEKYCLAPDSVFVEQARTIFMRKNAKMRQKENIIDLNLDDY